MFVEQVAKCRGILKLELAVSDDREADRLLGTTAGREHARALEAKIAARRKSAASRRTEAARLKKLAREFRDKASAAGENGTAVRDLAASVPAERIVPAPAKARKGDDLAPLRAAIYEKEEEALLIGQTPDTYDDMVRRSDNAIDALAAEGAPRINARKRTGDPANLKSEVTIGLQGNMLIGDGGAKLLIWLMRDELKAKVRSLIPRHPDAMTVAQREKRLAQIAAEKLDLERREEAVIEALEQQGRAVERRPDADPRAILGVEIVGGR